MDRPNFVRHWSELEGPDDAHYPGDDDLLSINAPLGRKLGLRRIAIHHERVPPGRRTSYPHAESALEEFVFVLEGTPDAWIDGHLVRLQPGDAVGFSPGTGISHTFLNNTPVEVRLLVIGEPTSENRIRYPLNATYEATCPERWVDPPDQPLGPHDGRPKVEAP